MDFSFSAMDVLVGGLAGYLASRVLGAESSGGTETYTQQDVFINDAIDYSKTFNPAKTANMVKAVEDMGVQYGDVVDKFGLDRSDPKFQAKMDSALTQLLRENTSVDYYKDDLIPREQRSNKTSPEQSEWMRQTTQQKARLQKPNQGDFGS